MKIGIIGLGLIGGSIFKSLNRSKYEVIGLSSSVEGEFIFKEYEHLSDCNLIFVCTPMNATLNILDKLDSILSSDTIVTDVCSVKSFLCKKQYKYKFIPSHPMAGTENSGWGASFEGLFKGAKWVITPIEGYIYEEQSLLENIIEDLGAEVIITTPEEHDRAVALVSHIPLIISQALCENIADNKLAQTIVSSGFRDTTRLALSNPQLSADIMYLNEKNIKDALSKFQFNLKSILNDSDYLNKSVEIKSFRQNLYQ